MYYFAILCLIILISWAMMLNIAKVITQRMELQNKADNVALSIAVDRARTMNIVAAMNYLIGVAFVLGNWPAVVQTPMYDIGWTGAYYRGDMGTTNGNRNADVKRLRSIIVSFQNIQKAAIFGHNEYVMFKAASLVNDDGLFPVIMPLGVTAAGLGLKRNTRKATFETTYNLSILGVHGVYPGGQAATLNETWFISTKDIYKQKIYVTLIKYQSGGIWSLAKLFGSTKPNVYAYSAAAIYNTKGTMFPSGESAITGLPNAEVALIIEALYESSRLKFVSSVSDLAPPGFKWIAVSIAEGVLSGSVFMHLISFFEAIALDDSLNPMKSYINAKDGGWSAHLVPWVKD